MTKEEAYEVWMAASRCCTDEAPWPEEIEVDKGLFENWWSQRAEKPEEATQTTTTGDGIPYEYISSTSTAPDSFFGRVASAGGAKDTKG